MRRRVERGGAGGAAALFDALCDRSSREWPATAAMSAGAGLRALPTPVLVTAGAVSLGSPALVTVTSLLVCVGLVGAGPAVGLTRGRPPGRER